MSELELIDIYDAKQRHLGTATREAAHQEGLWHFTCHYWLVIVAGGKPWLLFQERAGCKKYFPGLLDASAAGHLKAGESAGDGLRELEEELGIEPSPIRLTPAGIVSEEVLLPGLVNNEFAHLFFYLDKPNTKYRLEESEVAALWRAPLGQASRFFGGECQKLRLNGVGASSAVTKTVSFKDFTPHDPKYYQMVCAKAAELLDK